MNQNTPSSFTGRSRRRKTRFATMVADRAAQAIITVGGIGTIVAVLLVGLFLFLVVAPLFGSAEVKQAGKPFQAPVEGVQTTHLGLDEYRSMGLVIDDQAVVRVFRLDNGTVLETQDLNAGGGPAVTAWGFAPGGERVAVGYSDGTVRYGEIGFGAQFLSRDEVPAALQALGPGQFDAYQGGMIEVTPQGQFRLMKLRVSLSDPLNTGLEGAVELVDAVTRPNGDPAIAALSAAGELKLLLVSKDFLGNVNVRGYDVPYQPEGQEQAVFLGLDGLAANAYVAFSDGRVMRFYTQRASSAELAETVNVLGATTGDRLERVAFALGRDTLITGDSKGGVRAWFTVHQDDATTPDKRVLQPTHDFGVHGAAVTAIGASARSRIVTIGFADGVLGTYYLTSAAQLATKHVGDSAVKAIALAPKEDGIVAMTDGQVFHWSFDPKYPEASINSLFTPVWYVGMDKPMHVWQSSAATDAAEPKYGMVPLIFGTLKATSYALSFAIPIALLAAIYTSQFMDPSVKGRIKPVIEMMASLPSVVLGFLAGLVIAPFVEDVVPTVLAAFVTVPTALVLGAFLWQMLPNGLLLRIEHLRILPIALLAIPGGVLAAMVVGPGLESLFFGGNLRQWLAYEAGREGADPAFASSLGGWAFFLGPIIAVVMAIVIARYVNPWFRDASAKWKRGKATQINLAKFLLGAAATVAVTLAISAALSGAGLDLRGDWELWGINLSPADTYVQRNALIVGFAMGFAVIPIIFTIADDAMTAVPTHLISASLGAGATPWQTAVRVVIPTAMSGIFSACMIGLGRAVGETMIVLMAAGNTPILDLNIFQGFRTLSANIATELPEAVKNSTHYRTLFLSALVLFLMTFVINTFAEMIRQRFRRRAVNL